MARKTQKTLKLESEFNDRLKQFLTERFGAVRNEVYLGNMYELALATEVGPLLVQPNGSWVAMRFVEVERAKMRLSSSYLAGYDFNSYSGKYNSVFLDDLDIQGRLDVVQGMIERVVQ
jgi:hypothetical protein